MLAGGGASLLAAPWVARAEANTLRIGIAKHPVRTDRAAWHVLAQRADDGAGSHQWPPAVFSAAPIEFVFRDSKGQPQEAARIARELVNSTGCELLIDAEASSASFAVQEVVRDLGSIACIHTNSETSSLTADPKIRAPTAFRSRARACTTRSPAASISPNTRMPRTQQMGDLLAGLRLRSRHNGAVPAVLHSSSKPDVELITEAWPKLGQPDFTEVITKLIQPSRRLCLRSSMPANLSAFVNQGNVYALFAQMTVATPNVDYPVLAAIKNLPAGIQSATRYLGEPSRIRPANKEWGQAYPQEVE